MCSISAIHRGVLFVILVLLSACSSERQYQVLNGESTAIISDDRLVFINYWATWCLPCLEEMPELADFRETYLDSVEVYAVNYDAPGIEELRQQIEELNVEIPALVNDPAAEIGYDRPLVLPTTVIMDQGIVVETLVGPQTKKSLESVLSKWRQ